MCYSKNGLDGLQEAQGCFPRTMWGPAEMNPFSFLLIQNRQRRIEQKGIENCDVRRIRGKLDERLACSIAFCMVSNKRRFVLPPQGRRHRLPFDHLRRYITLLEMMVPMHSRRALCR